MFAIRRLPVDDIVRGLRHHGALSLPVLSEAFRLKLVEEAANACFRPARETIGEGSRLVRQRMEVCDRFDPASRFLELRDGFQAMWESSFAAIEPGPFESPVTFNDLMLQRYTLGELGVTPHRDRSGYRNVICLFVLAGSGRFGVCADRGGRGSRDIAHRPGDVILTRAPGFQGSDARPFHFVRDITEPRYVFGLRHER